MTANNIRFQSRFDAKRTVRGGALDGLRFLAAFLIVLYHYGNEAPVALDVVHPVFLRGYLATDFFLMLSGYVLGQAYGRSLLSGALTGRLFVLRRILRLWPAHLIVLAGFAVLLLITGALGLASHDPSQFLWSALPAQILLVQAWGFPGGEGWNFPSWSLSALIVCYAAFPLFWKAQSRFQSAWRLLAFVLLGVIQIDLMCGIWLHHSLFDLPFKLGVIRALPLFVLGMALSRLVQDLTLTRRTCDLLLGFAVLALVALQVAGRFDLLSIVMIAVIIVAAAARPILQPSVLLARGAALSFSLFVTHILSSTLWFGMIHALHLRDRLGLAARWSVWSLAFVFALAVAWTFDRYIDGPVQAWLKPRVSLRRVPRLELERNG